MSKILDEEIRQEAGYLILGRGFVYVIYVLLIGISIIILTVLSKSSVGEVVFTILIESVTYFLAIYNIGKYNSWYNIHAINRLLEKNKEKLERISRIYVVKTTIEVYNQKIEIQRKVSYLTKLLYSYENSNMTWN